MEFDDLKKLEIALAQLASARKALEIAKDAIEFYGLDDFEETTERTLQDIENALKDLP